MIRLKESNVSKDQIIFMHEMKPLEIGTIVNSTALNTIGHVVMRTASNIQVEIMDLTNLKEDSCWTGDIRHTSISVKLFPVGQTISATLFNT